MNWLGRLLREQLLSLKFLSWFPDLALQTSMNNLPRLAVKRSKREMLAAQEKLEKLDAIRANEGETSKKIKFYNQSFQSHRKSMP
jgi:predicted glycosyl hydrolase (DUF1957 family)